MNTEIVIDTPEGNAIKVLILNEELKQAETKTASDAVALSKALQDLRVQKLLQGFETVNMATVRISGTVDPASVKDARERLYALSASNPGGDITFDINSGGGSFLDGMELFGVLRELSKKGHKITTRISGFAGSMAGVLAQAGDHRQIREGSYLHIHEAASGASGKASEVMDTAKFLEKVSRQMCDIYAERSTLNAEQIYDKMQRKEWFLVCHEALDLGFVDEIV